MQSPPNPSRDELDLLKVALDHARAWMTLHADQRLRALNFWLIGTAFLTTAFVTTLPTDPALATAVAAMGVLVSITFQRLERRTRDLVRRAEEALAPAEARLAALTAIPALELVKLSNSPREPFTSYGKVIRVLQLVAVAGFTLGALVAYSRIK